MQLLQTPQYNKTDLPSVSLTEQRLHKKTKEGCMLLCEPEMVHRHNSHLTNLFYGSEMLTIKCRPFNLPRDFTSIILVAVYIPPQAAESEAAQQLSSHITDIENSYPDATVSSW